MANKNGSDRDGERDLKPVGQRTVRDNQFKGTRRFSFSTQR